jgi:hypothetical protein
MHREDAQKGQKTQRVQLRAIVALNSLFVHWNQGEQSVSLWKYSAFSKSLRFYS